MDNSELLALAREYSKNVDLYELLGIDSLKATEANEVKRAYRKQSIKYHPDKLGERFDPEKWQLLERARDVLMDTPAKDAYDSARSAALREQERRKALNAKKQAAIDDLEARERGEVPQRLRKQQNEGMSAAEYQELYQAGNRKVEERKRKWAEAEERERLAQELASQSKKQKKETQEHETQGQDAQDKDQADVAMEDDDPEIAAIQRRIREAQEKKAAKAARKAEKAARKGGEDMPPSSKAQDIPKHPTTGSQADEKKKAPKFSFPTSSPATSSTPATGKSDWSSIKERLKAAQAERDKRKAEDSTAV